MGTEFTEATPDDVPDISRFLASVFDVGPEAAFLRPGHLLWKYHEARGTGAGGTSFVMKCDGPISAHAGLWPITLSVQDRPVHGFHLIDWAGSSEWPGIGVLLLRKLSERSDFLLTVGGSAPTRAILPRIGYRTDSNVEVFARVLRPWRQLRRRPKHDWKSPARLARNLYWALPRQPSRSPSLSCRPIDRFGGDVQDLLESTSFTGALFPRRTVATLNHMLSCPGIEVAGFLLHRGPALRGYLILSRVLGQVRIADVRVRSEDLEEWKAAISIAVERARSDPEGIEIVGQASSPLMREALASQGFRLRIRDPLFILDPHRLLPVRPPLHLQLLDGDAAFLENPGTPFAT